MHLNSCEFSYVEHQRDFEVLKSQWHWALAHGYGRNDNLGLAP